MQQQRVSAEEIVQEQRVKTPEINCIDLTTIPKPSTSTIRRISVQTQLTNNKNDQRNQHQQYCIHLAPSYAANKKLIKLFYEGEVMAYDTTNNLYRIKYRDGDIDDFNYDELTEYRKPQQKYRKKLKLQQIKTPTTNTNHEHDFTNGNGLVATETVTVSASVLMMADGRKL